MEETSEARRARLRALREDASSNPNKSEEEREAEEAAAAAHLPSAAGLLTESMSSPLTPTDRVGFYTDPLAAFTVSSQKKKTKRMPSVGSPTTNPYPNPNPNPNPNPYSAPNPDYRPSWENNSPSYPNLDPNTNFDPNPKFRVHPNLSNRPSFIPRPSFDSSPSHNQNPNYNPRPNHNLNHIPNPNINPNPNPNHWYSPTFSPNSNLNFQGSSGGYNMRNQNSTPGLTDPRTNHGKYHSYDLGSSDSTSYQPPRSIPGPPHLPHGSATASPSRSPSTSANKCYPSGGFANSNVNNWHQTNSGYDSRRFQSNLKPNMGRGGGDQRSFGRGGGGRGSRIPQSVSANMNPELFAKPSMVMDPWKDLVPVCLDPVPGPEPSRDWLPKSIVINNKKLNISSNNEKPPLPVPVAAFGNSGGGPSLADSLTASLSEAVYEDE